MANTESEATIKLYLLSVLISKKEVIISSFLVCCKIISCVLYAPKAKMPKGRFPFMRTIEYLSAGRINLKKSIKTMTVSFTSEKTSLGLR